MIKLNEQQEQILREFAKHDAVEVKRDVIAREMGYPGLPGNIDLLEADIRSLHMDGYISAKFFDGEPKSTNEPYLTYSTFKKGWILEKGMNYVRGLISE